MLRAASQLRQQMDATLNRMPTARPAIGRPLIPVNEPVVPDEAKRLVNEAMDSGWLSSAGPMVPRFEQAFADLLGVRHAVATSSGTTALHLALAALGIGPGDEVIVADFTMIASACAVFYTGAVPVFVDVEPGTGTLDPDKVLAAITPRSRAIMPVHIYGHSADMDPLLAIAQAHGLWVVEDAAQAHGARYKRRACGALGHLGAFSFYGNKIISTGEGGMLTTDDGRLAERARSLRNMAHRPDQRFAHDELGFSYRMGNLQAALGLGQLAHLPEFLQHKRWMAAAYAERLGGVPGLQLPTTRPWADNTHWMYAVRVDEGFGLSRDQLSIGLRARGIETRDFFRSCASQPLVRQRLGPQPPCPVSEAMGRSGLYLPSGLALTPVQLARVCDAVLALAGSTT